MEKRWPNDLVLMFVYDLRALNMTLAGGGGRWLASTARLAAGLRTMARTRSLIVNIGTGIFHIKLYQPWLVDMRRIRQRPWAIC